MGQPVTLISHGFQPDYEAGFANGLAANGLDVTLAAADRSLFAALAPSIAAPNLRGSQDRSRPRWRKAANLLQYYTRLLALLCRGPRRTVHLIGLLAVNSGPAWPLELLLYRLLGHRVVLTVHNVVPHGPPPSPWTRACLKRTYGLAHALVVHTPRAAERLKAEFGVAESKLVYMEHGLDNPVPASPEQRQAARHALQVPEGERLVLSFGAVLPYKGVDLLLEAARLPGWQARVLIAGRCGDATHGQQLRQTMASHPQASHIEWMDRYLSEEEVTTVFRAADVLALPYRAIDQSGVLFMALRHGVPAVAFDVGSFAHYMPHLMGQVVAPNDVAGLSQALMAQPVDETVRQQVRRNAERFVWRKTVRAVLPLYQGAAR